MEAGKKSLKGMMAAGVNFTQQSVLRLRSFLTCDGQTHQRAVALRPLGFTVASLFFP